LELTTVIRKLANLPALHGDSILFIYFQDYFDEFYPQDESGCESSRELRSKNATRDYPIAKIL
jgi:hypothetical protein